MGSYREIDGDLLELFDLGVFDAMGHGANCFCRMRSGIAGQISKKFPGAVYADNKTEPGDKKKLGNFTYWEHPNASRLYNLYTQYHYGREENHQYLDYMALESALMNMKVHLDKEEEKVLDIGLPKIGCGLAQGDWVRVKGIIQLIFDDHNITIVNYAPTPEITARKLF
jgi:O-acetyl-ADP-ribose deacetylase (regulator of RNase III)